MHSNASSLRSSCKSAWQGMVQKCHSLPCLYFPAAAFPAAAAWPTRNLIRNQFRMLQRGQTGIALVTASSISEQCLDSSAGWQCFFALLPCLLKRVAAAAHETGGRGLGVDGYRHFLRVVSFEDTLHPMVYEELHERALAIGESAGIESWTCVSVSVSAKLQGLCD